MAKSVEILIPPSSSPSALAMLYALRDVMDCRVTSAYTGKSEVLVLYGVGAPDRDLARKAHVASGRHVVCWDLGYFGREKVTGYLRCSIDHEHPQGWLDRTPNDASRWDALNIALREDADPRGPILLVGLGRKSRSYLRAENWESERLVLLRKRFPAAEIIYRPKLASEHLPLDCRTDADTPIERLLRGASLVSCRHSNVAVDAIVSGVPFECDDGAATWLRGKPFTADNRLDFLRRLAHWQYRPNEAGEAWQFLRGMLRGNAG